MRVTAKGVGHIPSGSTQAAESRSHQTDHAKDERGKAEEVRTNAQDQQRRHTNAILKNGPRHFHHRENDLPETERTMREGIWRSTAMK